MSQPLGLYGHIRQNMNTSRLLIAGFFAASMVCWVLVNLSYNLTFRAVFGEQFHREMFGGATFSSVRHASEPGETRLERRARLESGSPKQNSQNATHRPMSELAGLAVWSSLTTLYVPLVIVGLWFAYFWYANARLVSWATGAIPASSTLDKRLFKTVEVLAIQTGQPMPELEIIESDAANAYATGLEPASSTIAVTRGLLNALDDRELAAVVAHEYTHILNRDSRVMTIATVFVGMFEGLFKHFWSGITGAHEKNLNEAQRVLRFILAWPAMVVFIALCASFAVCWIPSLVARARLSQSREFLADAGAVELTKDPDALVSALQKIARLEHRLDVPASMQALMIFGAIEGLLATHPSIEDRIAALRAHAGAIKLGTRVKLASAAPSASGASSPQPRAFGRRAGSGPELNPRTPRSA